MAEAGDQILQRQRKLEQIIALGCDPYPHEFHFTDTIPQLLARHSARTGEELERERVNVKLCGRILTLRLHGKAGFAHLQNEGGKLQVYVKLDAVGERGFALFQLLDLGDIVGVEGHLFRTRTGELTVHISALTFLAKALLPLPEKWHGLADVEIRYRQRYLDLISNERVREIFLARARIIQAIRRFLDSRGYVEVETPAMQTIASGAAARPFVTHHNAFDIDLYLRIALELPLKRLIVGGLDRVYEIGRIFRNEGVSTQHNPEFTMLEFYQAYANYRDLMQLTEEMLTTVVREIAGGHTLTYRGNEMDFSKWRHVSVLEAIVEHWPAAAGQRPTADQLKNPEWLEAAVQRYNGGARANDRTAIELPAGRDFDPGHVQTALFEAVTAGAFIQPTLVYDYPASVSPLAKTKDDEPAFAERFEVFAGGLELGNAYSELNDPEEQLARFQEQLRLKKAGFLDTQEFDQDYVRALRYGMPPTGGEGIGIDRLTMLLTDTHSIREVILFPLLRPLERGESS